MAPRGLSAEEKRVRLLEIFHETKDFFQLKELEKLGPKMKGIVSQSVKEVLQGLVDDGLVQADKIGSSNFFWSFPSQRGAMVHILTPSIPPSGCPAYMRRTQMQNRLVAVKENQASHRAQLAELRTSIESEKAARPDSEERAQALNKLAAAKKEVTDLENELAQCGACDPVKVEEKKRAVMLAKEAAVRWTDNYLLLLSYFTRQTCVDPAEIKKYLGVDDEYEDIC